MFWENLEELAGSRGFWTLMAALFGVCIGSFLNVCIWRMPRGESVVFAPSHCPKCSRPIKWYENIPILSYFALRGRCRGCREAISPRYWLVEALTGLLFVAVYLNASAAGWSIGVIVPLLGILPLAIAAAFIDVEHRIIPDKLTLSTGLCGVALAAAFPAYWMTASRGVAVLISLAGWIGVYLILRLVAWGGRKLFKREALGLGDVKYVACSAAVLGWQAVPWLLLVGALAGALFGVLLALRRREKLKETTVAFAPWLGLGALAWCFALPWCPDLLRFTIH